VNEHRTNQQSINQSINQSVSQSVSQSINKRIYRFFIDLKNVEVKIKNS